MKTYVVGIAGLIAVLLVGVAAVVTADGMASPRTFEDAGRLDDGAEVRIEAGLSTSKTANEAFPDALWWGDQQGSSKTHLSFLKVSVSGKPSWVRLSAYVDLADVREVALKTESDGFRVEIEGGEQSTHYTANVYFDREGYLLRRRVEGASFPSEVWEETNYSFIRRKGM